MTASSKESQRSFNSRVLVIDDCPSIRDDYARVLGTGATKGRYDLVLCESGEIGIEAFKNADDKGKPFAIVFCDMKMAGGMNGLETCAKIRKWYPATEMVLVTAYSNSKLDDVARENGLSEKLIFLKKPFYPDEIRQLAAKLTQSWQIEYDLRNALKNADNARKSKLDFYSMVTHDFRTPLSVIIGSAQTLREPASESKNFDKEKFIGFIEYAANRLNSMVSELLAFSQLETRSVSLNMEKFNLGEYFETIYREELEALFIGRNLKSSFYFPYTEIIADKEKLRHIVVNLVSNAIKFTTEGFVEMRCSKSEAGEFVFTASDTGRGIPEDCLGKVFDEFYQVDRKKDEREGTGLGLAIVKKFVELHGGRISVNSEEGVGSTFSFNFPVNGTKLEYKTERNVC